MNPNSVARYGRHARHFVDRITATSAPTPMPRTPMPTPAGKRPKLEQGIVRAANAPRTNTYRSRANIKALCEKEIKGADFYDFPYTAIVEHTTTNDNIRTLNVVVPGTGSFNRIGRKINILSLRVWGTIYWSIGRVLATDHQGENWVRLALVWDKQPNSSGTAPTFDTIFGTTNNGGGEACSILDPLKYDNMARFKIIRNWILTPPAISCTSSVAAGVVTTTLVPTMIDEFVKLPSLETTYGAAGGSLADIATGALYLVVRAHKASAENFMAMSTNFKTRMRFTD